MEPDACFTRRSSDTTTPSAKHEVNVNVEGPDGSIPHPWPEPNLNPFCYHYVIGRPHSLFVTPFTLLSTATDEDR